MLDLTALEVALGLGFVYLVFSLVISRVNEAVAGMLQCGPRPWKRASTSF